MDECEATMSLGYTEAKENVSSPLQSGMQSSMNALHCIFNEKQ